MDGLIVPEKESELVTPAPVSSVPAGLTLRIYRFVPGRSDGSHPGRGSRDATAASRERYTM